MIWYHERGGYGFVMCKELGERLHISKKEIPSTSRRKCRPLINPGQVIEFSVAQGHPLREAVRIVMGEDQAKITRTAETPSDSEEDTNSENSQTSEHHLAFYHLFDDGKREKHVENDNPLSRRGPRQRLGSDPLPST